ncbi:MAG: hypothetical protein ACYTBJ_00015 [Planctomycetota bacterium]
MTYRITVWLPERIIRSIDVWILSTAIVAEIMSWMNRRHEKRFG